MPHNSQNNQSKKSKSSVLERLYISWHCKFLSIYSLAISLITFLCFFDGNIILRTIGCFISPNKIKQFEESIPWSLVAAIFWSGVFGHAKLIISNLIFYPFKEVRNKIYQPPSNDEDFLIYIDKIGVSLCFFEHILPSTVFALSLHYTCCNILNSIMIMTAVLGLIMIAKGLSGGLPIATIISEGEGKTLLEKELRLQIYALGSLLSIALTMLLAPFIIIFFNTAMNSTLIAPLSFIFIIFSTACLACCIIKERQKSRKRRNHRILRIIRLVTN